MTHTGTIFLKVVLVVLGLAVLALSIFGIVPLVNEVVNYVPDFYSFKYPVIIALFLTAAIFYFALYNAYKLLTYIDQNKEFSDLSVKALKYIKYCGISISVLYLSCMPLVFAAADKDDAPGGVLIGLVISLSPIVVSVFAAVLEKLIKTGIEIKTENDLTV